MKGLLSKNALLLGLLALSNLPSSAADISDTASRTSQPDKFLSAPGLIKGGLFMQGSKKRFEGANELNLDSYQARMEVSPTELNLQRIRDPQPNDQIVIKFNLKNESDKGSTLYFPTAQRCEVVIRDPDGKIVYTWSEDYDFAQDSGYSYLNAGEHLNYQLTVPYQALRGKIPVGQSTITASLVNYPQLRAEMPLQIQP
jgi:hypothetical protein